MISGVHSRSVRLIGATCLLVATVSGAAVALASHRVDPDELSFVYVLGGPTPSPKSFTFYGTGACNGGQVTWTPTWVQVSPTSLPDFPDSGGTHSQTFTVSVNVSGLTPGAYTGSVTVDPTDNNSRRNDEPCDEPKSVEVELRVLFHQNERTENHGQCVSQEVHEALEEDRRVDGHQVSQWAREECDEFLPEQAQKDKNDDRPGIEDRDRRHHDDDNNPEASSDDHGRGRGHSDDSDLGSSGRGRGR